MNSQRHPLLDGGGVERIQVGMVKVAGLERGWDQRCDQPQLVGLFHDVDGHLLVFDGSDTDTA